MEVGFGEADLQRDRTVSFRMGGSLVGGTDYSLVDRWQGGYRTDSVMVPIEVALVVVVHSCLVVVAH